MKKITQIACLLLLAVGFISNAFAWIGISHVPEQAKQKGFYEGQVESVRYKNSDPNSPYGRRSVSIFINDGAGNQAVVEIYNGGGLPEPVDLMLGTSLMAAGKKKVTVIFDGSSNVTEFFVYDSSKTDKDIQAIKEKIASLS